MKQFQIESSHFLLKVCDSSQKKISRIGLKRKLVVLVRIFEKMLLETSKGGMKWDFCLTLCGATKIRNLNKNYRLKNKITDVLSFPVHDSFETLSLPLIELGDVFICREVAKRQARQFKITEDDEIIHLLVHGFLHLLGYDHEKSTHARLKMQEKEDWILDQLRDEYGRKKKD